MCAVWLKEILLCVLSLRYLPSAGNGRGCKSPEYTLVIRILSCSLFTSLRVAGRERSPQFPLPPGRKRVSDYVLISFHFNSLPCYQIKKTFAEKEGCSQVRGADAKLILTWFFPPRYGFFFPISLTTHLLISSNIHTFIQLENIFPNPTSLCCMNQ